jgi:glycosyltransferase involved in cell wall biosynthesis
MDILAPWSLASYIPSKGFNPLYRGLARVREPGVRIVAPKMPGFDQFRELIGPASHRDTNGVSAPEWASSLDSKLMFHEFIKEHGADDVWLQSHLSGDVELHHTAPATRGDRPFLFHCESFLPIFFPFLKHGIEPTSARTDAIRKFYRDLFESENCLGIVSHVPETLTQISDFFQSSIIDDKLVSMPIGLDPAYIAEGVQKSQERTDFVFLGSLQEDAHNFALRGGVSALKLALALLHERRDLSFCFRARRPDDDELAAAGIDVEDLKRFEGRSIVWIQHYLSQIMQNALIARCHFLLLPSAGLHSNSIMSALANGTVPIVTDTIGTDVYVKDMVNGAMISGIRSEIWQRNEDLRITENKQSRFIQLEAAVTSSLIAKVRELLGNPHKVQEMAGAARTTVRQRFDGNTFVQRLIGEVHTRNSRARGNVSGRPQRRWGEGERCIEDVSDAHFEAPPEPIVRVRLPNGSVYQFGRNFVFVPRAVLPKFADDTHSWSFLRLANDKWNPSVEHRLRTICARSLGQCVQLARSGGIRVYGLRAGDGMARPNVSLALRIWFLLRPYRTPFLMARSVYHTMRRLGVMR